MGAAFGYFVTTDPLNPAQAVANSLPQGATPYCIGQLDQLRHGHDHLRRGEHHDRRRGDTGLGLRLAALPASRWSAGHCDRLVLGHRDDHLHRVVGA